MRVSRPREGMSHAGPGVWCAQFLCRQQAFFEAFGQGLSVHIHANDGDGLVSIAKLRVPDVVEVLSEPGTCGASFGRYGDPPFSFTANLTATPGDVERDRKVGTGCDPKRPLCANHMAPRFLEQRIQPFRVKGSSIKKRELG